jgi:hypothetical protein
MKNYLKHYWKYARQGSTGLAIAPFSSQLWGSFIDSLVDVFMTLITFVFLLACWCVYPLAVLLFALAACEGERRSVKFRKEWLERRSPSHAASVSIGETNPAKRFPASITQKRT